MSIMTAAARHDQRAFTLHRDAWIDSLVGLACILPLLLTAHVPLTDLPNHLARQFIVRDWADSPYLQTIYYVQWALIPNLALDIFVIAARQIMSIDMAVRAFCIATLLALFLGTRLVNRELSGGRARMYRIAPLLCYGGPFQYGFLSYCFGIGLALVLFGLYLRVRAASHWRLAWFIPLSFALMLCHLAAFGLFAIAVGACELTYGFLAAKGFTRRLSVELLKRQIAPLCCLVPIFLIFLWFSPTAEPGLAENAVRFSSLHDKARSIAAITLFTSPKLEVSLLVLAIAGLAAALVSAAVRLHPIARTVVAIMLVIWLLLPQVAFGTAFIDYRVPWAISFFLLAGLVPGPRYQHFVTPLGFYFSALVAARIGLIAALWLSWEPTLAAIDDALGQLPLGTSLKVVEGRLPSGEFFRQPDLTNVASFAVARRQAYEPGMFASFPGQILYFQPRYHDLWRREGSGAEIPASLDRLDPAYSYVLVLLPDLARISPSLPLTCVARGSNFELLKVVRSAQPLPEAERQGGCPG